MAQGSKEKEKAQGSKGKEKAQTSSAAHSSTSLAKSAGEQSEKEAAKSDDGGEDVAMKEILAKMDKAREKEMFRVLKTLANELLLVLEGCPSKYESYVASGNRG